MYENREEMINSFSLCLEKIDKNSSYEVLNVLTNDCKKMVQYDLSHSFLAHIQSFTQHELFKNVTDDVDILSFFNTASSVIDEDDVYETDGETEINGISCKECLSYFKTECDAMIHSLYRCKYMVENIIDYTNENERKNVDCFEFAMNEEFSTPTATLRRNKSICIQSDD